jgi:iron complex outermembrane receptor protein
VDATFSRADGFRDLYGRDDEIRPQLQWQLGSHTITDAWRVNDFLTINNRFSYLHRTLDVLGNGDSTNTKVVGDEVVGRQLRQQDDNDQIDVTDKLKIRAGVKQTQDNAPVSWNIGAL